jgi:hypothetical protein
VHKCFVVEAKQSPVVNHVDLVRTAKLAWEVCSALELAWAKEGSRATVRGSLAYIKRSSRSFYSLFDCMDDALLSMTQAANNSALDAPRADHMLLSMGLGLRPKFVTGSMDEALAEARARAKAGLRATPDDVGQLVKWFSYLGC